MVASTTARRRRVSTRTITPDARLALDSIRRIVRVLREGSRNAEGLLGISGAQLFVLQRLEHGPLGIGELAERTATHQSSVSVVVQRLVDAGLVTRQPSLLDARRRDVSLTARGRALVGRAPRTVQDRLLDGMQRLSPASRRQLAARLVELIEVMGVADEPAAMLYEDADD